MEHSAVRDTDTRELVRNLVEEWTMRLENAKALKAELERQYLVAVHEVSFCGDVRGALACVLDETEAKEGEGE